ncbi:hypothetical protein [Planctomyces sp. SH-PL62]|uniref:hypothetical protein n=1 Tax=Planctomyces sp. SH-PL62 TaxID=1636152 RepID=UPI00078E6DD3|nr:hypothetical protein [Planctomyces sp. SH-PL62]AMV38305.1 hypothetical protein VT85_12765 [Planctomyces sp. SH-PL62]
METARCPSCRSESVLTVDVLTGEGDGSLILRPRHCRAMGSGVGIRSPFSTCVSCGFVWTAIDPAALRDFIQRSGEEIARQQLDEFDRGPFRDLPDTDLAREIGAAIADVDARYRERPSAAIRRYRELRGVTWDQAHHDTRNWRRLTREEKLELFGWSPKKKTVADDFDSPFP